MPKKQKSFKQYINDVFVSHGEMVEEKGEDWFIFSLKDNMCLLCVLDGCGGIGSRKYPEYDNKTGAFIASRAASEAVYSWFEELNESSESFSNNTISEMKEKLKEYITDELKKYEVDSSETSSIKGALVKSFPTTISLILFMIENDMVYSTFIWAGDSRGYVLSNKGLMQITADDIETGEDAFDNLSSDSKLTNFVTSTGGFKLNEKIIKVSIPSILITATDGCFGYFSTPMEFEYLIVDSLTDSKDMEEWKNAINQKIKLVTGDDYTIGIAIVGYKNFKNLKNSFLKRKQELYNKYISKIDELSSDEKMNLWKEYKKFYCKGM